MRARMPASRSGLRSPPRRAYILSPKASLRARSRRDQVADGLGPGSRQLGAWRQPDARAGWTDRRGPRLREGYVKAVWGARNRGIADTRRSQSFTSTKLRVRRNAVASPTATHACQTG